HDHQLPFQLRLPAGSHLLPRDPRRGVERHLRQAVAVVQHHRAVRLQGGGDRQLLQRAGVDAGERLLRAHVRRRARRRRGLLQQGRGLLRRSVLRRILPVRRAQPPVPVLPQRDEQHAVHRADDPSAAPDQVLSSTPSAWRRWSTPTRSRSIFASSLSRLRRGRIARSKPSLTASCRRSAARGAARPSPASPSSPNTPVRPDTATLRCAAATAQAIPRSIAGSPRRTPPATLTNTSRTRASTPARSARTARSRDTRLTSTPVVVRRPTPAEGGATSACTSHRNGRVPSALATTTDPAAPTGRSARKSSDGFSPSTSPDGRIANTPISDVAPKRFFALRRMRWSWAPSPSNWSTTSTTCSSVLGPASIPSLVTWPTTITGTPVDLA